MSSLKKEISCLYPKDEAGTKKRITSDEAISLRIDLFLNHSFCREYTIEGNSFI